MGLATRPSLLRSVATALLAALAACGGTRAPWEPERVSIPAPSLAGSVLPNPELQPALVFLPPSYPDGGSSYPVVYYLPGFTTDVTEYVDGTFDGFHLGEALHRLSGSAAIREMIVVVVNGRNRLGGSFYVNSPVTGQWQDHVTRDVVPFVEARFRTSRDPAGRGIAGDSMGGFGALSLAMRHPDLFGAVFALSPALFDERGLEDRGTLTPPYVEAWLIDAERMRGWPREEAPDRLAGLAAELLRADGAFAYRRAFALAYGAAFAPDPEAGPPWVAHPFQRRDGRLEVDPERVELFRAGLGHLEEKVARHEPALRALRGIGLDIGRNDPLAWVPRGTRELSRLLAEAGIPHQLTEHEGGHVDHLGERVEQVMLPFFSRTLEE